MSLEQVHAFYKRTASDEEFRSRLQAVNSKEECSQIVKMAGFDFTQQEFEEYTARLLESDRMTDEMYDLSEKELETVFGGGKKFIPMVPGDLIVRPMYGLFPMPIPYEPPLSDHLRPDGYAWESLF